MNPVFGQGIDDSALDSGVGPLAWTEPLSLDNVDAILKAIVSARSKLVDALDHAAADLDDSTITVEAQPLGYSLEYTYPTYQPEPRWPVAHESDAVLIGPAPEDDQSPIERIRTYMIDTRLTLTIGIFEPPRFWVSPTSPLVGQLRPAIAKASDALIVIYNDRAILDAKGKLRLRDPRHDDFIPFQYVFDLISGSTARRKLLVLDLTLNEPLPLDQIAIPGTMTVAYTSAEGGNSGALITALLDTLQTGIPGHRRLLDITAIYDHLTRHNTTLTADTLHILGDITSDHIALGRNPLGPPEKTLPPPKPTMRKTGPDTEYAGPPTF